MKAKVINANSTIGKNRKNADYDMIAFGFNGNEIINYGSELKGDSNRLKQLAVYSETTGKTVVSAFDTDNYGIIKHSAGVFDDGKLLGVSDMTVAMSNGPYMPGAFGKLYDTRSGKFAVAIGDDLYRYELFKSFAVCGADFVVAMKKSDVEDINYSILRAYSYLLGFPILLVCKNRAIATDVQGNLIPRNEDGVFELRSVFEFSLKTTKIRLNR